jgi:hypothetical protein
MSCPHGLKNYKDTKAKWRHLEKLTSTGTLRQVFIRAYELYIQLCLYFRPSFAYCCHSILLSGSLFPSFPLFCVNKYTAYTYTV